MWQQKSHLKTQVLVEVEAHFKNQKLSFYHLSVTQLSKMVEIGLKHEEVKSRFIKAIGKIWRYNENQTKNVLVRKRKY